MYIFYIYIIYNIIYIDNTYIIYNNVYIIYNVYIYIYIYSKRLLQVKMLLYKAEVRS